MFEKKTFNVSFSTLLRSALSGVFPLMETMEQETREPAQSASGPTDDLSASIRDLFQTIYQNLHQRHYLDAIVHALYIVPDDPFIVKPNRLGRESSFSKFQCATVSLRDNGKMDSSFLLLDPCSQHALNERMVVGLGHHTNQLVFCGYPQFAYPQPDELPALIKQVENDRGQDLTLLSLILTKPLLRFRLCAVAHLLEVAFAEVERAWYTGERPRMLAGDDMTFVMETLQGFFSDLFQEPKTQTILRVFSTDVYEWSVRRMAEENADNIALPNLPNVVKKMFPCHVAILDELRPILMHCKSDPSFRDQASDVFKFILLFLKERGFVSAGD